MTFSRGPQANWVKCLSDAKKRDTTKYRVAVTGGDDGVLVMILSQKRGINGDWQRGVGFCVGKM